MRTCQQSRGRRSSSAPSAIPDRAQRLKVEPRSSLGHSYEEGAGTLLRVVVLLECSGASDGEIVDDLRGRSIRSEEGASAGNRPVQLRISGNLNTWISTRHPTIVYPLAEPPPDSFARSFSDREEVPGSSPGSPIRDLPARRGFYPKGLVSGLRDRRVVWKRFGSVRASPRAAILTVSGEFQWPPAGRFSWLPSKPGPNSASESCRRSNTRASAVTGPRRVRELLCARGSAATDPAAEIVADVGALEQTGSCGSRHDVARQAAGAAASDRTSAVSPAARRADRGNDPDIARSPGLALSVYQLFLGEVTLARVQDDRLVGDEVRHGHRAGDVVGQCSVALVSDFPLGASGGRGGVLALRAEAALGAGVQDLNGLARTPRKTRRCP